MNPMQIKAMLDIEAATKLLNDAMKRAAAANMRCYLHDGGGYFPPTLRVSCAPEPAEEVAPGAPMGKEAW